MTASGITQLIINSPYEEPQRHWRYDREARLFDQVDGRRPAAGIEIPGDLPAAHKPHRET